MVDWQGLLKFTLKYSDGTAPTAFKQMSLEDKRWLEQAMQEHCNSQIKRIQQILKQLQEFSNLQELDLLSLLQELQQLLDSLDKGSTLYKMNGHITLLRIIFYSKFQKCKVIALQIYSAANQNDAGVQNQSIGTGALEIIELLKKEKSMVLKENYLAAISATIRGQNLQAKRIFIKLEGLELLESLVVEGSTRLKVKIYTLLRDLLFYDDHLHLTFNDLSSFSNTSSLQKKDKNNHQLTYDPNQEMREKNELPENAKFKGIVHSFVESRKQFFLGYLEWLKQQIKEQSK